MHQLNFIQGSSLSLTRAPIWVAIISIGKNRLERIARDPFGLSEISYSFLVTYEIGVKVIAVKILLESNEVARDKSAARHLVHASGDLVWRNIIMALSVA